MKLLIEKSTVEQVLEALKECRDRFFPLDEHETDRDLLWVPVNSAVTKCEAALAQPTQKPVAWNKPELETLKHSDNCRYWDEDIYCTCGAIEYAELQFWKNKALAQPPLPVQEPVASVHVKDGLLIGSHRDESKPFPDGQYGLWPITTPPLPAQEPVGWISVKDALPKAVRGVSYKQSITDTVLVRHSDRPDYPITAHAVVGEGLGAGISILTEGASEYPEISWYSASSDLNNPFGLKNDDYERYLPRIFGLKITHWMPISAPPQREWVELTDEEIDYQAKKDDHGAYFALGALWAGAKLKERNK